MASSTRPRCAQLVHGVDDRADVAVHDPLARGAELGAVAEVVERGMGSRGLRWCRGRRMRTVMDFGRSRPTRILSSGSWHGAVQGLAGEAGEVDRDVLGLERTLDVRAEADWAFGALADEDAAALSGDDQAFFAQLAQGVLHGHRRDVVRLRQLLPGRQLVARRELLGQDGSTKSVRDLHIWRSWVVRVQGHRVSSGS